MKKLLAVLLACLLVFSLVACGGDKEPAKKDAPAAKDFETLKAEYLEKTAEDLLKEYVKDIENPTEDEIAALVKTGIYADISDQYVFEYNITEEALSMLMDEGADGAYATEYVKNLIDDEDDLVRAYVYNSFSSYIPLEDAELEDFLIEKATAETDKTVVACVLHGLGNALSERTEFVDFAIECAKDEDPAIRYWAVYAINFYRLEDNEKCVDALIPLMKDSDAEVAKSACKEVGGFGNEKAVEPLKEILADEALVDLHGAATESLEDLWMGYPIYEGVSEAAYRAHLDYLNTESTNPEIPSWTAISSITDPGGQFETWKSSSTYFKPEELIAALTKIVGDAEVDDLTRNTAIQKIAAFGTVEDLEALKAVVAGSEYEASLLDTINSEIENK